MSTQRPPDHLLEQAADWLITLHYAQPADVSAQDRAAFEAWLGQSDAHRAAWQQAQAVLATFKPLPELAGGAQALRELQARQSARRRQLRTLGALLVGAPVLGLAMRQLPWTHWRADIATATGERRSVSLPDGSQVVLNTASAVQVQFSAAQRRLRLLAGEILVTTHADSLTPARSFVVATPIGELQALGTQFSVREHENGQWHLAVFDGTVRVRTAGGLSRDVAANTQVRLGHDDISVATPVSPDAALWTRGTLLALDMPLGELIGELARYRRGILRCDGEIAAWPVSGAIALDDTDAALALLAQSLPIRVIYRTPYWVTVTAR